MNRLNEAAAESDLQRALDCGELIRLYQPIVELESRRAALRRGAPPVGAPGPRSPHPGRVPRRRGRQRAARAHRMVGRDRSGAPRRGVAACASRTSDHGVGQSVGGAPREARAVGPRRAPAARQPGAGPQRPGLRGLGAHPPCSPGPGPRPPHPAAQPRCGDRGRRLRRDRGRDRGRSVRAARLPRRAARATPCVPARRDQARPERRRPPRGRRGRRGRGGPLDRRPRRRGRRGGRRRGRARVRRGLRSGPGILLPSPGTALVHRRSARDSR